MWAADPLNKRDVRRTFGYAHRLVGLIITARQLMEIESKKKKTITQCCSNSSKSITEKYHCAGHQRKRHTM